MTKGHLDDWRISTELSVIDAAILITGNNPEGRENVYDEDGNFLRDGNGYVRTIKKTDYSGFEANFNALKSAILNNRLSANIMLSARDAESEDHEPYIEENEKSLGSTGNLGERKFSFRKFIRVTSARFFCKSVDVYDEDSVLFFLDTPDWYNTTIEVKDLIGWLETAGQYPEFFFPENRVEGFRDETHPRYSPELACAVAAWEAVETAARGRTVKQTLEKWVKTNGKSFGIVKDGTLGHSSIERICQVVNWAPTGGAPKTLGSNEELSDTPGIEKVQNFEEGF